MVTFQFSFWISIQSLVNICFSRIFSKPRKITFELGGTVLTYDYVQRYRRFWALLDLQWSKEYSFSLSQVCEEFKAIARVLYDKPNSIEELSEQREYMKQIPENLKKNQELIDKAMIDYELIEEFNYNISAEDFNAK